jgi:outer membrane protein
LPNEVLRSIFLLSIFALPAAAQPALSLPEAISLALARHPSIEAAKAQTNAAASRTLQARAGFQPKVNYAESFQSSNNPVFAFSTLLSQRRFTASNFAIDALNRPGFVNNFQSQLTVDQLLYDFGGVRANVQAAQIGQKLSAEQERHARMRLIAHVARSYHSVTLAEEFLKAAQRAVTAAEADLTRAIAVRDAGRATDVDALSLRVHLAAMREQQIQRQSALDIARATLNDALGQPLETPILLSTPLSSPAAAPPPTPSDRPELRQAQLSIELAQTQVAAVRSALFPQITTRAAFEADRGRFVNQAGANWYVAAGLRWNLFNGFTDRARREEATQSLFRAQAQKRETASSLNLELRQAQAAISAAQQRLEVTAAAVAHAEESLRITRNRYEAGLTTVTDLLRTEVALLETTTRRLAAVYDHRLSAVLLELAAGTLAGDSDVLK